MRVLRRAWHVIGGASVGRWSLNGPGLRSLGERLPAGLAWGLGLGLYGFAIAVSAEQFADSITSVPQIAEMIRQFYPDIDFSSAGGILQLAIFGFVALVTGVAAGTLVGGWASDERERRLEVVLSTPTSRVSWFVAARSGCCFLYSRSGWSLVWRPGWVRRSPAIPLCPLSPAGW